MKKLRFKVNVQSDNGKIKWGKNQAYAVIFENDEMFLLTPQDGNPCGIEKSLKDTIYTVEKHVTHKNYNHHKKPR